MSQLFLAVACSDYMLLFFFVAAAVEIDLVAYCTSPVSYTMTLVCDVKAGDILRFYLGDQGNSITLMNTGANSAARTSLMYWKL